MRLEPIFRKHIQALGRLLVQFSSIILEIRKAKHFLEIPGNK